MKIKYLMPHSTGFDTVHHAVINPEHISYVLHDEDNKNVTVAIGTGRAFRLTEESGKELIGKLAV